MTPDSPPQIAYLVHDLNDPAVARRIALFRAGGASVALAGFHRGAEAPAVIHGARALDLGITYDARLGHRAAAVLNAALMNASRLRRHFGRPHVLVARNLEMLALGARIVSGMQPRPRLVYECLDIHRLLAGSGLAGSAVQSLERRLGATVDLIVTSSPAFISNHIARQFPAHPTLLIENKVFAGHDLVRAPPTAIGAPWRIGWFGALRCRRSLDVLGAFAAKHAGAFEIILRGNPTVAVFPDLAAEVSRLPHVTFHGRYAYPDDLAAIYGEVHFSWCIDLYEEGLNSKWLLPNRLYEGGFHRTVPLALADVETGAFLRRHGVGIVLAQPTVEALDAALASMTGEAYVEAARRIDETPAGLWRLRGEDCREIVDVIAGRRPVP